MSEATPKKKKFTEIANKNFIMLFIAYTIICLGHSMISATSSAGWSAGGLDMSIVGLIASIQSWSAFVIRPFSAPIVDRGNKKKIYFVAVFLFTIVLFMYSRSMVDISWAAPTKIIHGIAWTFISTVTAVVLSEYVPREDLGTAMGFFMVSQLIASAISQPIAFELANRFDYPTMFMVFGIIVAVGCLLVLLTSPTKTPERQGSFFSGIKLNNLFAKEAIMPMLLNICFQGTRSGFTVFLAAFALEDLGIANVGIFATVASFVGWVARPMLGALLDKKGTRATLIPAGLSFALGLICLAAAQNMVWIIAAGVFVGIGQNGINPVLMTISIRAVPPERKAAGNSTQYLGMDIGSAVAQTAGGFIVSAFGYRMGFAAFLVPVVVGTVAAVIVLTRQEARSKAAAN